MLKEGHIPSVIAFNALIDDFCEGDKLEEAMKLF